MGDILKNWNKQELIFRLLMHGLRNQIFTQRLRVLYLQYKIVLSIQEIIKNTYAVYNRSSINVEFAELKGKPLNIISSCTVLAQSECRKRHDIFAKIIHMNLAVKFNLLKDTQPHYIYKPESCLENDNYKLYFDRTVLTDIHIQHNRPDIIILNKQQKQAYLLDIAVPNSHNITQTYNTKINKYLELSVAMRNLWSLEKNSVLPLIISATGIVPQSLFKNLKILDLENTLVVEIQKGILLYSCHIVRKFLNIDTEHNTQQSQNAEARRR
jgi:hypothetical protein